MPTRNRVETLDALVWASLTEEAVIARLANKLVRSHNEYGTPTKKTFETAIRATMPPRGRAGPMLSLLEAEFQRQRPIYWQRKLLHDDWEAYQQRLADWNYRVNAAYGSRFGRPVHVGRRNCPLPFSMPYEKWQEWEEQERNRDKGDKCHGLVIHQGCTIALLSSVNEQYRPQLKVRYPSGKVFTTYLRDRCENFGELFRSLGGRPVTGALAHGHRVDIDYRGRRFNIHHPDGEVRVSPWLAKKYEDTTNGFREEATDIVIVGHEVEGDETSEG